MGAWKKLIRGWRSHRLGVFSREACLPRRSCVRKLSAERLSPVRTWRAGTSSSEGYPTCKEYMISPCIAIYGAKSVTSVKKMTYLI